jgi:hypothetical protein
VFPVVKLLLTTRGARKHKAIFSRNGAKIAREDTSIGEMVARIRVSTNPNSESLLPAVKMIFSV